MSRSIRTRLPSPRLRGLGMLRPRSWWPSLAARQDEAFRNIWQALRQHDYVRPGLRAQDSWRNRAASYVTCAIRVPMTPDIEQALAPLREALEEHAYISLLPNDALTITIQQLGFLVDDPKRPDEISRERLKDFYEQAEVPICDFPAFHVEIGGFNSFLDTPFLDVHDDGWCSRVHHRLRDFVLMPVDDNFAYLPHIVLGYYNEEHSIGSLPAKFAPWRDQRFGSFTAASIEILEVSTSDPFTPPSVLKTFELGHQRGATDTITSGGPKEMF